MSILVRNSQVAIVSFPCVEFNDQCQAALTLTTDLS